MSHEFLSEYLGSIETCIRKLKDVYVEKYEEEFITNARINLRLRIRFMTGHLLEINEAVIAEADKIVHLNYRYHFQDESHHLVFRYDNAPHFPGLKNFPHHKHALDDVIDSCKPTIHEILAEALDIKNQEK